MVWSLASPQPERHLLLAGTPFESLTALREIEGVARPTATLKAEGFVGSATAPTKKTVGLFPSALPPGLRLQRDYTPRSGLTQSLVAALGLRWKAI